MPIEYSEYKSLVDILDKSSDSAYEELMAKEKNVLSTVNHVVKYIKDREKKNSQFVNKSLSEIAERFFLIWPVILKDMSDAKSPSEMYDALVKEDRVIYYGILLIVIGLLLFMISSVNSTSTNIPS